MTLEPSAYIDPTLDALLIVPKTEAEKERDRKERMMQEVCLSPNLLYTASEWLMTQCS